MSKRHWQPSLAELQGSGLDDPDSTFVVSTERGNSLPFGGGLVYVIDAEHPRLDTDQALLTLRVTWSHLEEEFVGGDDNLNVALVIGLVVRRAGRGLDWRFPAVAAGLTLVGAVAGNVVVAAAFTADELGTSTFTILRAVTSMTWPVFFNEVVSAADIVYALFGAATAAFYANRRLLRSEYSALRKWREQRAESNGHQ